MPAPCYGSIASSLISSTVLRDAGHDIRTLTHEVNRIHAVMTEAVNESWFHEPGLLLGEWQPEQLAKAIQDIEADKKEPTPGRIVAALNLQLLDRDVRKGL